MAWTTWVAVVVVVPFSLGCVVAKLFIARRKRRENRLRGEVRRHERIEQAQTWPAWPHPTTKRAALDQLKGGPDYFSS